VLASELTRGPWDPEAQHGGAPAALLMREFERLDGPPDLVLGRVTYELLRPVPLGELRVSASVARPGRRVQLVEGSIWSADGTEVVRARALKLARAGVGTQPAATADLPPGPEQGRPSDFKSAGLPLFPVDGVEIRFTQGAFYTPGPATAWFRLTVPVVAGEEPSGYQRLAATADFPNGIATELDWNRWLFINPDLTIHIEREPQGEWLCLDATMRVSARGCGQTEAVVYDAAGRVARSLQTLYVAPRSV